MKQMSLIEMDGFLKGKCIPIDLKVNETNAEYLVRKFDALEAKCAALAAENAGLKDYLAPIGLKVEGTPTTDAFLAEVRAQGLEMFAQKCNSKSEQSFASDIRDNWKLLGEHATDFAAELRKGGKQ